MCVNNSQRYLPGQKIENAIDHLFLQGYKVSEVVRILNRLGFRTPKDTRIDKNFVRRRSPEHSVGCPDYKTKINRVHSADGIPQTPYVLDLLDRIEKKKQKRRLERSRVLHLACDGYGGKDIIELIKKEFPESEIKWTMNKVEKFLEEDFEDGDDDEE